MLKIPKGFDVDSYPVLLKEKAIEDIDYAEIMIKRRRNGYGLFFAHASIQKTLAMIICKQTRKMPPWRGDLTKLARLANVNLTREQREICKTLNFYHKEGLYLGLEYPEPTKKEAMNHLLRAKEFISSLPNPLAE